MNQASSTISDCCPVDEIRKGDDWLEFEDKEVKHTSVKATLRREFREWPEQRGEAINDIIEKIGNQKDDNVFTNGSVQRKVPTKSG